MAKSQSKTVFSWQNILFEAVPFLGGLSGGVTAFLAVQRFYPDADYVVAFVLIYVGWRLTDALLEKIVAKWKSKSNAN